MPCHAAGQPVSRQQGRDQKYEGPGSQQRGFDELPLENCLGRDGQAQQKGRFPISEKIRITDDQIAEQEEQEQKSEEQKKQPFDQKCAQPGKFSDKPQPDEKQPKRQHQIAGDEQENDAG